MSNDQPKPKRGRPPVAEELVRATQVLIHSISRNSQLSAVELEEAFNLVGTPPGGNWRRYANGKRTLTTEARERIAKLAIKKGWLRPARDITWALDEDLSSWEFLVHLGSTADLTSKFKEETKRAKRLNQQVKDTRQAIEALVAELKSLMPYEWYVCPKEPPIDSENLEQYELKRSLETTADLLSRTVVTLDSLEPRIYIP